MQKEISTSAALNKIPVIGRMSVRDTVAQAAREVVGNLTLTSWEFLGVLLKNPPLFSQESVAMAQRVLRMRGFLGLHSSRKALVLPLTQTRCLSCAQVSQKMQCELTGLPPSAWGAIQRTPDIVFFLSMDLKCSMRNIMENTPQVPEISPLDLILQNWEWLDFANL